MTEYTEEYTAIPVAKVVQDYPEQERTSLLGPKANPSTQQPFVGLYGENGGLPVTASPTTSWRSSSSRRSPRSGWPPSCRGGTWSPRPNSPSSCTVRPS